MSCLSKEYQQNAPKIVDEAVDGKRKDQLDVQPDAVPVALLAAVPMSNLVSVQLGQHA